MSARISALLWLFVVANAWAVCRTPLGDPCRTVQATVTGWQFFSDGAPDLARYTTDIVTAVRADGSTVTQSEDRGGALFRSGTVYKYTNLYLAPTREIVLVNYQDQTIGRREPLIWHDLPFQRSVYGDRDCATGVRHYGTDLTIKERTSVAGVEVVRWRRNLGYGGYEEVDLAPSLGCLILRNHQTYRNSWWLPILISTWEAKRVELGPPNPDLFVLPAGYREIEHPAPAALAKASSTQITGTDR